MAIRVEHGRPETIIKAAKRAGEARAAATIAQQAQVESDRLEAQQQEFEFRKALRQQDMVIDLQMNERAKLWEIDKMQLRSQMDFQREEQQRQRKLDSIDSAMQQIDKEVLAGRITEQEAYPIKQKLEISKTGVNVPASAFAGDEGEGFGVQPYWMRGRDAPEGTPERQLYDAKMAEQISGERRGTVPYYLDPEYIRTNPSAARQAQEARGIFLSDEEFNDLTRATPEAPLGNKSLDVGVRAEPGAERGAEGAEGIEEGRVRVISPEGQSGTILESERQDYINQGFTIVGESPAFRGVGATGTWDESKPSPKKVRRKPTIGNISWERLMSKGFK